MRIGMSLATARIILSEKGWKPGAAAANQAAEPRAATAAIIVSALGVSLAVYGVVLALLSLTTFAWYLYGLCAVHGIHLQLRWDRYEEAARRASR